MKKILTIAAMFSALLYARVRKDDELYRDNMMKTNMMVGTMMDGPARMGMNKEISMASMEMSKGNMRGACMHYMKAQKMGMMKSKM